MNDNVEKQKSTNIVSNLVFFTTLAVIIPSIVSVIFPALILSFTISIQQEFVDPFEIGAFALPLLSVGSFSLGFGLLYYSGNLPNSIQRLIKFILNFEVSQRISLLVILIFLTIYVALSIEELAEPEGLPDFQYVKSTLEGWPFNNTTGLALFHFHVKNFLLYTSEEIFQNIRIVPFLASISLLILTYFFTVEISKKRFSGLISISVLLQSFVFLTFDSTSTYSNFWTLFYLFSLYLIIKKWQFSILSYVSSILSKPLTILFLPMTLFFTYRADISRKQKIYTALSYGLIVAIGFVVLFLLDMDVMNFASRDYSNFNGFLNGFASLGYQLRYDQFFTVFLFPLVWGLFMLSRRGNKIADAILFLIMGALLSAPLSSLAGIDIQVYRFIPFIVFFSIGVGALFSQKQTKQELV